MSGHLEWLLQLLEISPKRLVDERRFEERLKVQKAVFLLRHLRVSPFTRYTFNMYLRGPYSPDLAREYYAPLTNKPVPPPQWSKEKEDVLLWFVSHESRWLEIASSILSVKERYPRITENEIYSILRLSKPWVSREEFGKIMRELEEKRLK